MNKVAFLAFLQEHHIPYELFEHEPFFTVEQAQQSKKDIPGYHTKNLFLVNKQGGFFLVTVRDDKRVHLHALSVALGSSRFSFASAVDMERLLGVKPGSVTPLGLVHDTTCQVAFVLDKDIAGPAPIACHPLINDSTVVLAQEAFARFMQLVKHVPVVINIPVL
jgi:Ala-tRNA(Pro) deacylase